jgi:hypothetical protein
MLSLAMRELELKLCAGIGKWDILSIHNYHSIAVYRIHQADGRNSARKDLQLQWWITRT